MDRCEAPYATDDRWSIESYVEMEEKLHCLRLLVCDLLKTNQELRAALLVAGANVPHQRGAQPRQEDKNFRPVMAK